MKIQALKSALIKNNKKENEMKMILKLTTK